MFMGMKMKLVFLITLLGLFTGITPSSYTVYFQDISACNSTTFGDDEVIINGTFRAPNAKNAKLKHATLGRSSSVMLQITVKEVENVTEEDRINCNTPENHFVKLKHLAAYYQSLNRSIVMCLKLKGTGMIGRTEVIVNCSFHQGYSLEQSSNGTAMNLGLSLPLSFKQSEKEKSSQMTAGYFLLLMQGAVLLTVSCKFTVAEACPRIVGTGIALLANSIVEPLMMLGVCTMLGTPYLGRVGGTASTLSPCGGVALAVTCLLGADELTAAMILSITPLLSLVGMKIWEDRIDMDRPLKRIGLRGVPVAHLLGLCAGSILIMAVAAIIRQRVGWAARRIRGLRLPLACLVYGASIAIFSCTMIPVYYPSITLDMLSLALTHTALVTGCMGILLAVFFLGARHAAIKYVPQLKSIFLCILLPTDPITLLLLGQNLESQEADAAMCYAFTLSSVALCVAGAWPVAWWIYRVGAGIRRQGVMGACPDPVSYVPLASDAEPNGNESRSTDESDTEPRHDSDGDGDGDGEGEGIEMQEMGGGTAPEAEGDVGIVLRAGASDIHPEYLGPGTSAPRNRNRSSRSSRSSQSSRSSLGRTRDASGSSHPTTDRPPIALIHSVDDRAEGELEEMPALEDEAYTHHWF